MRVRVPRCPSGTRGTALCLACHQGKFSRRENSSLPAPRALPLECRPCPQGSAQGLSGSSACVPCSPGSFSAEAGAPACAQCDAGSQSLLEQGPASCPCAGQWLKWHRWFKRHRWSASSASRVASRVTPSPLFHSAGKATASHGATNCSACAAGTFSYVRLPARPPRQRDIATAPGCSPAGFSGFVRQSGEEEASPSTPCASADRFRLIPPPAVRPEPCARAQAGWHACRPCAAGSFAAQPGQSACEACPEGETQPARGQSTCTPKPKPAATPAPQPQQTPQLLEDTTPRPLEHASPASTPAPPAEPRPPAASTSTLIIVAFIAAGLTTAAVPRALPQPPLVE